MRIPAYTLLDWDANVSLYDPHRSTCTSSSLLVVAVILLSLWIVQENLLPIQSIHSLSKMWGSLVVYQITAVLELRLLVFVREGALLLLGLNSSELSESSESSKTSTGLYFLFSMLKSMLSTNLDILITQALLIYANCQCQSRIYLFWLTRWVGWPRPIIAIAFGFLLTTVIAFLGCARLRMNKFWSFFVLAMTSPFLINITAAGSLWYVILLSRSCLREIGLESHSDARATLCNFILSPQVSGIKIILISFIRMTCPAAMIKSMLLALMLLKNLQLLHRWHDAHKSKNQVLEPVLVLWSCGSLFATMNAVVTGPGIKRFKSDFLLVLLLDAAKYA